MSTRLFARWREVLTGMTPLAVLGTLICCALPIALVSLGAGSAVASLVSAAPWLVPLTRNKEWIFLLSGLVLVLNYRALYRSGAPACGPGDACHPSHFLGRWVRRVYWGSVALYAVAFAAAYLSLPLAKALGY